MRCHSRFCRHCARARSMEWFHRLRDVHLQWPLLLTLTLIPGPDAGALVDLALRQFAELRRRVPRLRRGFYAVEVKPNPAGWYVHLHVLADCVWVDRQTLLEHWHRLTRAKVVDVRRVHPDRDSHKSAVLEVVKYCTKAPDGLTPAQVDYLSATTHGRRLVATWGSPSLLDTQETTWHQLVCPVCGSWVSFAGFLPEAWADDDDLPDWTCPRVSGAGPPMLLGLS